MILGKLQDGPEFVNVSLDFEGGFGLKFGFKSCVLRKFRSLADQLITTENEEICFVNNFQLKIGHELYILSLFLVE